MLNEVGFGVKFIKDYNELNILRFIKSNGPVSRAEISKTYKISKAAVSDIVARLIRQGFVSERGVGKSTSRGGRKPVMLTFNPMAGYVLGVEIKRSLARVALADMDVNLHEVRTIEYAQGSSLKTILPKVFAVIHEVIGKSWVQKSRSIGIGVAIPGLIDYQRGCIKLSDTLKSWEQVPVRSMFENEFRMSVVLENDVKTQTLGECLFGGGKNFENLVYLFIGDGIGAGIIINGSLLRGLTASAGEIGYGELGWHVRDKKSFPLLYNGQKDFGDILSNRVLMDAACAALRDGFTSSLSPSEISIDAIVRGTEKKDPLALDLLHEFGELLGVLCVNLINTLNTELLIISGQLLRKSDVLLEYTREKVRKDLLSAPAEAVQIISSKLKEKSGVMGAAGLVLEDLFYHGRLNVLKYRSVFK